jgi:5-methylcytosine-specific restriction enzyme subunit McrC
MSASAIPVRNIYYLLCYAWNRLPESQVVDVARLPSTELADLFAFVLIGGVKHLARRGFEQGYQPWSEELAGVRGRIDVVGSARRLLLAHGRASCSFDELTVNTGTNQILKSTLRFLAGVPRLDGSLRKELRQLHRLFQGVDDLPLRAQLFRTVQLHTNNRYYKFLLNICELVCGAWLVDERAGAYKFRDFIRDERKMARVFQDFVFNFYRLERPELHPARERIFWKAQSSTDPTLAMLPRMETDISLSMPSGRLIIDTKYYTETLGSYFDADKIHSANLYQLFAYLMNAKRESGQGLSGMLLYPVVDRELRLEYRLHDFPIKVCTVNLVREWHEIRAELLGLVGDQ